ncbi:hypothetical protein ACFWGD_01890 [Corynebacterium sp. NPDC060344]|uniref:hypothetical protein n=1 Tax=Corynebacterium sp. NPDC060344 TaxID=3347101 RepID=UPI003656861E
MQGEAGPKLLQAALKEGRIERIVRGVYATVAARARHETFVLLALAIGLTNGAGIVTGPAAAAIMGFGFIVPDDGRVDVLAVGSKDRRAGRAVARHAVTGIGREYMSRGVRVTSPARTALETCLLHGMKAGLVVVESVLWTGNGDVAALAAELRTMGRRRGIGSARRVLALASDRSQSAGESLVRWCIDRAGLPQPLQQVAIFDRHGTWLAVVDFFWPELGLVIEFDGLVKTSGDYGDPVQAARKQLERQNLLLHAGLRVIRLGWGDVVTGRCVPVLIDAYRQRRAQGSDFTGHHRLADVASMSRR